jgi:hypothetical protein
LFLLKVDNSLADLLHSVVLGTFCTQTSIDQPGSDRHIVKKRLLPVKMDLPGWRMRVSLGCFPAITSDKTSQGSKLSLPEQAFEQHCKNPIARRRNRRHHLILSLSPDEQPRQVALANT